MTIRTVVALALDVALVVVVCVACATPGVGPGAVGLGVEPYCVGTLHIWIRSPAEVDVLCRMARPDQPTDQRILGCYVAETQTIVAIDDAWVVMHELKHFFEGRWHE